MRLSIFLFACQLWVPNLLNAQLPKLIKNIGQGGIHGMNVGWTYPGSFASASGRLLFWGTDQEHGTELWVTDGTNEGTQLVKDIVPGPGSPTLIQTYYKQNDRGVYFVLGDIVDREIWFSDGTAQNTKLLLHETEQFKFDYNFMANNSAAVVYNNLFVLGSATDAEGTKRCIYRLEPEREFADPSPAIIWKDTLPITQYHNGIFEICEYKGQLVAVAQSATSEGLATINRDFGYTIWLLKTTGWIYNLGNINNFFLAFRHPGPENPLACIKDLNSGSLEILLSPAGFASPDEKNQVVKVIDNKLFFYTDQYSRELWVTDGTAQGTRPAPFQGTTKLIGSKGSAAVVFLTKENGSFALLSWEGGDGYQLLTEDQGSLLPSTTSYLETGDRQFIFSQDLFVLINGSSYRILGVPYPGDLTLMNFTYNYGYETKKLIGNNLIISGWNNTLTGINAIGQEPYKFSLDIKLWTGSISKDWHDARNWDPEGVPLITESILIPETPTSNYPVLSQNGSCRDLYVNFGNVEVGTNAALTVAGELSNYWALSGAGKIIMTAEHPALITGPGDYTFSQLELPSSEYQIKDESKTITSKFILGSNTKVFLNNVDLIINAEDPKPIENFSSGSFFVTNGIGSLGMDIGLNTSHGVQQVLPVGRSSYNPVTIKYEGLPATFTCNVIDEAFENGIQGNLITELNIDRTWDIRKIGGDQTNTNVLLHWQASDELPGFDRNKCFVRHYVDEQWKNSEPGSASTLNGLFTKEMIKITSFSPFTISSNLSALPLRLISFSSVVDGNSCLLKWTTGFEINVSHFEIEHANIPGQYSTLGIVNAENNGLNSAYSFFHQLKNETNYYRLKIVDHDERIYYSKVLVVRSTGDVRIKAYPNPVVTQFTISIPQRYEIEYILLRNNFGQVVYKKAFSVQTNVQVVNVDKLQNSIYYLEVGVKGLGAFRDIVIKQ